MERRRPQFPGYLWWRDWKIF